MYNEFYIKIHLMLQYMKYSLHTDTLRSWVGM